jgi:hypothetical protein
MKLARLCLFAFVLTFTSTAATCSKVAPPPNVPSDCKDAAMHILDDVASAIATDNWRAGLEDLVSRFGACGVELAVGEIRDSATKHAALDSLEALKAERAKVWLAERAGASKG